MNRETQSGRRRGGSWRNIVLAGSLFAMTALPGRAEDPANPAAVAPVELGAVRPFHTGAGVIAYNPRAETRPDDMRAALKLHATTLTAQPTLLRAVSSADSGARKTDWFKQTSDVTERAAWLAAHLRVALIPETRLIEFWLEAKPSEISAADQRVLLQDVGTAYMEDARRRENEDLLNRTSMLNTVKLKAEMRLKDVSSELRMKSIVLNVEGGGIGRIGAKDLELSAMTSRMIEVQTQFGRYRAEYERLKTAMEANGEIPEVTAAVRADERFRRLRDRLDDTEIRLAVIKAMEAGPGVRAKVADPLAGGKTPEKLAAPRVDAAKPEPGQVSELTALVEVLSTKVDEAKSEAATHARVAVLDIAQSRFTAADSELSSLTKRVDSLKTDLGELSNAMLVYQNLADEQKGLLNQIKQIRGQIESVMMLAAGPSTELRWHIAPETQR